MLQALIFSVVWLLVLPAASFYFLNRLEMIPSFVKLSLFGNSNLFEITWTRLIGFMVTVSVIYWNFSKKYGDHWLYCANLFKKIFYDKLLEK